MDYLSTRWYQSRRVEAMPIAPESTSATPMMLRSVTAWLPEDMSWLTSWAAF